MRTTAATKAPGWGGWHVALVAATTRLAASGYTSTARRKPPVPEDQRTRDAAGAVEHGAGGKATDRDPQVAVHRRSAGMVIG